jgi:hypothetical protein
MSEEKGLPQRQKCRWEYNFKNNVKQARYVMIHVAQNGIRWSAIVDRIPLKAGISNTS